MENTIINNKLMLSVAEFVIIFHHCNELNQFGLIKISATHVNRVHRVEC